MSDGDLGARSTATIKFGKGYEAPWYVAYGSPEEIRAQIIAAFGLEGDSVAGLSLAELIVSTAKTANALYETGAKLGAEPIGPGGPAPVKATRRAPAKKNGTPAKPDAPATASPEVAAASDDPPFETNEQAAAREAGDELVAAINAATTKVQFAALWRENQARFAEPAVKAAAAEAQRRFKA